MRHEAIEQGTGRAAPVRSLDQIREAKVALDEPAGEPVHNRAPPRQRAFQPRQESEGARTGLASRRAEHLPRRVAAVEEDVAADPVDDHARLRRQRRTEPGERQMKHRLVLDRAGRVDELVSERPSVGRDDTVRHAELRGDAGGDLLLSLVTPLRVDGQRLDLQTALDQQARKQARVEATAQGADDRHVGVKRADLLAKPGNQELRDAVGLARLDLSPGQSSRVGTRRAPRLVLQTRERPQPADPGERRAGSADVPEREDLRPARPVGLGRPGDSDQGVDRGREVRGVRVAGSSTAGRRRRLSRATSAARPTRRAARSGGRRPLPRPRRRGCRREALAPADTTLAIAVPANRFAIDEQHRATVAVRLKEAWAQRRRDPRHGRRVELTDRAAGNRQPAAV
jgi:hypothetical protein